jgi:hypothetical protein
MEYSETVFHVAPADPHSTSNTRLASVLLAFGARLVHHCPMEWVDVHESRENFCRHLEDRFDKKYQPKPRVTFNFDAESIPAIEFVRAFNTDYEVLNAGLEELIKELPADQQDRIRAAVSAISVRLCREALLQREWLVSQIKRMPENAKWDHVNGHNQKCVRMGKNSSAELRSEFLSKI